MLKKYRVEILCFVGCVLLFGMLAQWQSADSLSRAEVDTFVDKIDQYMPQAYSDKAEFLMRLRAWGYADDGEPVYMLNTMRFFEQLDPAFGVNQQLSPKQANTLYEDAAKPMLVDSGAYPIFAGRAHRFDVDGEQVSNLIVFEPELDNWDRILVVRYPARRSFFELLSRQDYLEKAPLKLASLKVVLTPMEAELVIPDLRWITGGFLAIVFLLVGWIRAARRG